MYVCMYVCMYVYMYEFMNKYVSKYVCRFHVYGYVYVLSIHNCIIFSFLLHDLCLHACVAVSIIQYYLWDRVRLGFGLEHITVRT